MIRQGPVGLACSLWLALNIVLNPGLFPSSFLSPTVGTERLDPSPRRQVIYGLPWSCNLTVRIDRSAPITWSVRNLCAATTNKVTRLPVPPAAHPRSSTLLQGPRLALEPPPWLTCGRTRRRMGGVGKVASMQVCEATMAILL